MMTQLQADSRSGLNFKIHYQENHLHTERHSKTDTFRWKRWQFCKESRSSFKTRTRSNTRTWYRYQCRRKETYFFQIQPVHLIHVLHELQDIENSVRDINLLLRHKKIWDRERKRSRPGQLRRSHSRQSFNSILSRTGCYSTDPWRQKRSSGSKISMCLLMINTSFQLNRKRLPSSLWSSRLRRHLYDQRSSSRCHGHKFSSHWWTAKRCRRIFRNPLTSSSSRLRSPSVLFVDHLLLYSLKVISTPNSLHF